MNCLKGLAADVLQELPGPRGPDEIRLGARVEARDGHLLPARPVQRLVERRFEEVEAPQRLPRLQEDALRRALRAVLRAVVVLHPVLFPPVAEEEELQNVGVRRRLGQLGEKPLPPQGAQRGIVLHDQIPVVRRLLGAEIPLTSSNQL